jgi:cell wall-associated NlpC family hydrolase
VNAPTRLDPRLTPATDHVAAVELRGTVDAPRFVRGRWRAVDHPLVSMADAPRGPRSSQLLHGERFRVIEERDGYAFGQAERDGYCGWVLGGALGADVEATHWIVVPATHLYPEPAVKAVPEVAIYGGSRIRVAGEAGGFLRLPSGLYVPAAHARPLRERYDDAVGVADLFLGTPYLWGGCSRWGIDCSGLVQMAVLATGRPCPRDSDMQQALGRPLAEDELPRRGDLVFWPGHVGFMADADTLLHANAHHMAVAYEPLTEAAERIRAKGEGEIIGRRRLD